MNILRKKWLVAADNLLRVITAREHDLARLKTAKSSKFIIDKIDKEIEQLVSFYNETEEAFKTFEQEALNIKIHLIMARKENEELKNMLMEISPEKGKELEFLNKLMKAGQLNSESYGEDKN